MKSELQKGVQHVEDAAAEYETAASSGCLYTISPHDVNSLGLNAADLESLYDKGLLRRGSSARHIYDQLLAAPLHGTCPLCAQRNVSTIDHYLPKSEFPLLSVVPANLVPCCKDCNSEKGTRRPSKTEDQFFHPYFDNFDGETYLQAVVQQSQPVAILFSLVRPLTWTQSQYERLSYHFKTLKLASLYSSQAASELVSRRLRLQSLLKAGGPSDVRDFLEEEATSAAAAHENSWRAAMYRALSVDHWFYSGGFN